MLSSVINGYLPLSPDTLSNCPQVKYGDVLRRFNAPIVEEKLSLNIAGLREKILSLFSFARDTDMMLTYVDEDGDVVALVDDDDLRDVVKQGLNPVRVTVKVTSDKNGKQTYSRSRSQSPVRSRPVQPLPPLPNLNAGVSEILRNVPEPLRETLMRFSADLASKASSSSPPAISELVDNLSKVSLSILGQAPNSNKQDGAPKSSSAADNKDSDPLKAAATSEEVKAGASMEKNEVKLKNVTEPRALFDFNAVAAALESQKDFSKPDLSFGPNALRRREKFKKNVECSNVKSHDANDDVEKVSESVDVKVTGKDIGSSSAPQHVSGYVAADRMKSSIIDAFKKAAAPTWSPSFSGPTAMYECPFSGTPLETISSAPPYSATGAVPFRRSNSQNDSSGSIFHRGVRCDGCGIHPIVGPRFKSKV